MYNDIAYNKMNPVQGNIINRPNGMNVYKDIHIDYQGNDVTPTNFINILKGNKTAMKGIGTSKVLESDSNDNVFIYFCDHGGTGLIAFPVEYLYAHTLIDTLKYMYHNNMYNQLVFYLEACESGSMFNRILPNDLNIYTMTASTPFQSSYACYWSKERNTYIGDVFSVNWLENSEKRHVSTETIHDQYTIDLIETSTSTVCEYGNLSIANEQLHNFLGYTNQGNTNKKHNSICPLVIDSRDNQIEYALRTGYNIKSILGDMYYLD
jgi:legumain